MDEPLDALQRKLSPGQLMDQALDYLRNGPGGFASNLGSRVRDNPIPVALTAVALGWLMMAGGREEKDRTRREIGRASCRERVCQYVSISVVAVSVKNKKSEHKE